ncbi:hypothetical protein [Flexivirga lutea]
MLADTLVAVVSGVIVVAICYLCKWGYQTWSVKRRLARDVLEVTPITMSPGTWKVALAAPLSDEEIARLPRLGEGDAEQRGMERLVRSMEPSWDAEQTEVTVMVRNVSPVDITIVGMRALWELDSDRDCIAMIENPPAGDFGVPQIGFRLGVENPSPARILDHYRVGDEDWFGGQHDIGLKPDEQRQIRIVGAMVAQGRVRWTIRFDVVAHGSSLEATWPSGSSLRTASVSDSLAQHLVTGVGSKPDGTVGVGPRDPHWGTG